MNQRWLDSAPWLVRPRLPFGLFAMLGFALLALAATAVYVTFLPTTPEALVETSQSSLPEPELAPAYSPTPKAVAEPDPAANPASTSVESVFVVPAPERESGPAAGVRAAALPVLEPTSVPQPAKQSDLKPPAEPTPPSDPESEQASPQVSQPAVVTTSQTSVSQPTPEPTSTSTSAPAPEPEPVPVEPLPGPVEPVEALPGPVEAVEPLLPGPVEPVPAPASGWKPLPANGNFDYQIGGDYSLPPETSIVSRDWFSGQAAAGAYSICYVNAFQTQADGGGTRPDELSRWPSELVLRSLGDDPNWAGEFLIDLSTNAKRVAAARWLGQMIDQCAAKGFDAVEFDNLDSWTRFDSLPFGQSEALAYAKLITDYSHSKGLAVGQKNTAEIISAGGHRQVGFDFAIAESCGQYNECDVYARGYGSALIIIEYDRSVFNRTCSQFGANASVVLRDTLVRTPNRSGYVYEGC